VLLLTNDKKWEPIYSPSYYEGAVEAFEKEITALENALGISGPTYNNFRGRCGQMRALLSDYINALRELKKLE